jgi:hypothetical protein
MARITICARKIFYLTEATMHPPDNVARGKQRLRDARKARNSCGFARCEAM